MEVQKRFGEGTKVFGGNPTRIYVDTGGTLTLPDVGTIKQGQVVDIPEETVRRFAKHFVDPGSQEVGKPVNEAATLTFGSTDPAAPTLEPEPVPVEEPAPADEGAGDEPELPIGTEHDEETETTDQPSEG